MKTYIKVAREQAGKTQKECADALEITLRAWQGYEQGIREPKFELLCKIADMFDVTTDYLLGRGESTDAIEELVKALHLDSKSKAIVQAYVALDPEERTQFTEIIEKIAAGAKVQLIDSPSPQLPTIKKLVRHEATIGELEDAQAAKEAADAKAKKNAG